MGAVRAPRYINNLQRPVSMPFLSAAKELTGERRDMHCNRKRAGSPERAVAVGAGDTGEPRSRRGINLGLICLHLSRLKSNHSDLFSLTYLSLSNLRVSGMAGKRTEEPTKVGDKFGNSALIRNRPSSTGTSSSILRGRGGRDKA